MQPLLVTRQTTFKLFDADLHLITKSCVLVKRLSTDLDGGAALVLYDMRLAILSFRRNPALTALMIGAIAVGIGAAMVTITLYHTMSGNPIWWKNDVLYAVTLDAKDTDPASGQYDRRPELPPHQLTYRDAQALFRSDIPTRKVMMYKTSGVFDPQREGVKPFPVLMRLTTMDFFAAFDVPFLYGSAWNAAADESPDAVVVLSKSTNDKVFGGANSVGNTISFKGHSYRIVGVLDTWLPKPKFYDLNNYDFSIPEDVYAPFRWGETLELGSSGNSNCLRNSVKYTDFKGLMNAECVWIQFWAELSDREQRARFQQFIDGYVMEQKQLGRFPRPLNNRLSNVSTWMETNEVVQPETRMLVTLALMFLIVCMLNSLGLMLAKFLGWIRISGLRRALGATRGDLLRQHLVEALAIGLAGGVIGLLLSFVGLKGVQSAFLVAQSGSPESLAMMRSLTRLDFEMVLLALGLSLVVGLLAGLYPAWRVCRIPPAIYLKTQ